MRVTMKHHRYPIRMQYLDSGNSTNFTSPGGNASSSAGPAAVPAGGGPNKSNALSPVGVAVIGVLAGAFLILSYYRIFLRYWNRHRFTFWGHHSDARNGGPSTIVLMEEDTWPPDSRGLDESLISRIPTCKYKPEEGLVDGTECSVCLGEFEEGEELRILPKCNHPFHIPCIDTWLGTSSTCPLCRVNVVLAAAVPYVLMAPVEREGPAGARGAAAGSGNQPVQTLIHHEIEVLQQEQQQRGQEFLEVEQLSGPSSSRASSRGSFTCAPDVDQTPDTRQSDAAITHHMRHLSLETDCSTTSTREIHVVTDTGSDAHIPRPKRRLHGHRHRSEGGLRLITDPKGKHPIASPQTKHPISSPQTKRFARLMGSSSSLSRSTAAGSSSLNQVVVELLAQEIFQNNVSPSSQTTTVSETSVRKVKRDNASFEVMWSINEQENPLMGPLGSFHNQDSEFATEAESGSRQLQVSSDSDYEDGRHCRKRSLKRSLTKYADHLHTWPSKLSKRYGSVNLRQNSFRRTEKVHTSEPVFEIFDF